MPDKWELIESPSGTGHLVPKGGGESTTVQYDLNVFRRMIETSPGQFIPGLPRIEGRISNRKDQYFTIRNVGHYYTLFLKDGRKLDFFFQDQDGSIANAGPRGLYSDPT